ncbi:MAG: hypothetical protein CM1200mP24_01790 [Gammaproteobacteria bacterium]|nr:MAG: hypothetical protein CM1200mP24_01790 [Gammaproteobacteria bacterium]
MRLIQPPGYITGGSIQCLPKANAAFDIDPYPIKILCYTTYAGDNQHGISGTHDSSSPVLTVGNQISEAIFCHRNVTKKQAWQEASDMLDHVGIGDVSGGCICTLLNSPGVCDSAL